MAFIIQKTATDQALVLDVREALVYPFDLGNWTKIQIGVAISATAATDSNAAPTTESIVFNNPKNGVYFGLKDSGSALPLQTGSYFIGWGTWPTGDGLHNSQAFDNAGSTFSWDVAGANDRLQMMVTNGTTSFGSAADIRGIMTGPGGSAMTGATSYCFFNAAQITVTGLGQVGQQVTLQLTAPSSAQSNPTTSLLRQYMNNFASPGTTQTFFFTSGFTQAGGPLSMPNSFFVYIPFFNSRVRLHAVAIERVT